MRLENQEVRLEDGTTTNRTVVMAGQGRGNLGLIMTPDHLIECVCWPRRSQPEEGFDNALIAANRQCNFDNQLELC